ncbi:hypothetical protein D1006_39195 [Burkholderia stabilis]|uniref:Uncharacterized protein n=1 Tax=Burkholderia stabilis TaxID=95485 RepID=A0A4Q2A5F0_9BURK|nr:hypothetical protein [Burkholderia stabilis]RXV64403.1 hypothetical protein D1006_39195 [Burkholderia stabilis]
MVNSIYPTNTQTLPAIQKIQFIYDNGSEMTAVLNPHPRQPGAPITRVDLECSSIRWADIRLSQHTTLIQAGTEAHHVAQSDAAAIAGAIAELRMTGEEFLTKPDVEQITGYPVDVV